MANVLEDGRRVESVNALILNADQTDQNITIDEDASSSAGRCRANSRRGQSDPTSRSYPPVGAVQRALRVLRTVNRLDIATINEIFLETNIPKPTIVRMLETLMAENYVIRDNMCGGYRITSKVSDLNSGYEGISRLIEMSRAFAVDLTRRIKWPIGLGVIDGDAVGIQFWTGAISPYAHTNTVLGLRADLRSTSMGRAYLAFCGEEELERCFALFHQDPKFDEFEERRLRILLDGIRADGYAVRDPRTKPFSTSTIAMPIHDGDRVCALISISFFKSAVLQQELEERIIAPLRATKDQIEDAFACTYNEQAVEKGADAEYLDFAF